MTARLQRVEEALIQRHPLAPLIVGPWRRRNNLRLVDALYAELAEHLGGAPLVMTNTGLGMAVLTGEVIRPS